MKLSSLRKGMVFEKAKSKDAYAVIDIITDSVSGFSREVITLGNLSNKKAEVATISELNNPKQWRPTEGSQVQERVIVEQVIVLPDNSEVVLHKEVKTSSPTKQKPPTKTPVVETENVLIEAKKRAQLLHQQNGGNAMTAAFANASVAEKEAPMSFALETQLFRDLMSCRYDDLTYIGIRTKNSPTSRMSMTTVPRGKMKLILKQEWDAFKEDGLSLHEVRKMGNRLKAHTPDQVGRPVSFQRIVQRLMQEIYHFGTEKEREAAQIYKGIH